LRKTLKAKGLSDKAISMVVESVFPSDEARGGRILQQARYDLTMRLVNKGMPTSEALKATAATFGEGGSATPGTYKFSHNVGGGGTSNTTLKIPGARQASVSTPSWVYAITGGNPPNLPSNGVETNIKSAAVANYNLAIYGDSIVDILERKQRNREEVREAKHQAATKSASSKIPGWAYECGLSPEELAKLG